MKFFANIEIQKQEIARLLGVHRNTVTRMAKTGQFPPILQEYCRVLSDIKNTLKAAPVDKKRRRRR